MKYITSAQTVVRTYLTLTLFNTLAASLIWGINTLFLLDAGLSPTEAFIANAFFTVGMLLFEVPTGVIADTKGRRLSYILGVATVSVSTLLYFVMWWVHAPFIGWIVASLILGLGFTFFSGATEAWLVDALKATKYKGQLEAVFSKAQIVSGVAMLSGSVLGGIIAQFTDLGVPYIVRALLLLVTLAIAIIYMKDLGFTPEKGKNYRTQVRQIISASMTFGFRNPAVRWVMLAAPFSAGVGIYVFYALQPYLLNLYGDQTAYWIAGLTAAIVAGAQIVGGLLAPSIRRIFTHRTTLLLTGTTLNVIVLVLIGVLSNFFVVIGLVILWAFIFAALTPVRQAYLNNLIPSKQRATVLSFDSLLASSGGVVSQPVLGKSADVWGYSMSYVIASLFQLLALPFLYLAMKYNKQTDKS